MHDLKAHIRNIRCLNYAQIYYLPSSKALYSFYCFVLQDCGLLEQSPVVFPGQIISDLSLQFLFCDCLVILSSQTECFLRSQANTHTIIIIRSKLMLRNVFSSCMLENAFHRVFSNRKKSLHHTFPFCENRMKLSSALQASYFKKTDFPV